MTGLNQVMADNSLKPLLVIEDNPGLQKQLKWAFEGFQVYLASDRATALELINRYHPGVVTLDLGLPPDPANATEGLAALEEILHIEPHTKVVVVTGNDDRQNALKAISLGAYDFYQKPIDPDVLALIVDRASSLYELEAENRRLLEEQSRSPLDGIVGSSEQMLRACHLVERVAPSEATTLILGESGTGKELFARALHRLSRRKDGPFVAINCAAIPDNLLESELFGYEKGAFTNAIKQTPGKLEYASGGTFFLDEIGDMPMALQAKMLRFLQERIIERLGGHKEIPVDVRVICATHHDLGESIKAGTFREDLYYRVSEIVIQVPALRERSGDRVVLAKTFLDKYARKNGRTYRGFSHDALEHIEAYDWPGNVRELENRVQRAVVLADGEQITAADLGFEAADQQLSLDLRAAREAAERMVIQKALVIHNYNMSQTAEVLGISRPSLYNLMNKLGMQGAGK
jgi:two-component system NtrC family response regulator